MSKCSVEISQVRPRPVELAGGHLDRPEDGHELDANGLVVAGWAVGGARTAVAMEVLHRGHLVMHVPLDVDRPDLDTVFSGQPGTVTPGFRTRLTMLPGADALDLDVVVVMDDQRRAPLAQMRVGPRPPSGAPLVSVVIPCYNQAHFLAEAIESVLSQTHTNIDVVVVDDGSTDNTLAVAQRYPGVRNFRQRNRGLAAARNAGLATATGEFAIFVDADDRLLPHAVQTGLETLDANPQAAFAAGGWRLISADGSQLPTPTRTIPSQDAYLALLQECIISSPAAVVYRRSALDALGWFEPAVSASADYDLYLRAATRQPVCFHGKVVAEYRRHAGNMTRDPGTILRSEVSVLRGQWPHVRLGTDTTLAYRDGVRRAQQLHGQRLAATIPDLIQQRAWRRTVAAVSLLGRYHPKGLVSLLRAGRR